MKTRSVALVAIVAVGLLLAVVAGAFAYDATQKHEIAKGITAGGVDIGGMSANKAKQTLSEKLATPLTQPLTVVYRHRHFRISAARAHLAIDVNSMVAQAVDKSRSGNFFGRAFRSATGGKVDNTVAPIVTYDHSAIDRLVARVERGVNRPPQNASVSYTADGLKRVPARLGLAIQADQLTAAVNAALVRPGGSRTVRAKAILTDPKVTTSRVAARYPTFIIVNRTTRQLKFYKRLKLSKTYNIAVGMAGLETPAGLYHIQNKQVNPSWHVPNSAWAGKLAGKVIPPGPADPIKARWMGIFDGAGIHGTDEIGSLGSAASHGCVRMAIPDVEALYDQVDVGTPVFVA
jgi:lipoprotein-anchoring transpeptidase ErfK/SrfK